MLSAVMFNHSILWHPMNLPLLAATHESNHGSLFGVGDGTVVMWPLVWVILAIGAMAIGGLIWAGAAGQFQGMQKVAERHLELED